jgi:hypothetical protein
MVMLPDWLVQLFTQNAMAESPEALLRELEHEKALVRALVEANLKNRRPPRGPEAGGQRFGAHGRGAVRFAVVVALRHNGMRQ